MQENWKLHAKVFVRDSEELINEIYPDKLGCDPEWMQLREYYDPLSGTLLEVEVVPPGYPIVHDFKPDIDTFYRDWLGRPVRERLTFPNRRRRNSRGMFNARLFPNRFKAGKEITMESIFMTGAASGIGRQTAALFAAKGWRVGLADTNGAAAVALAGELGANAQAYTSTSLISIPSRRRFPILPGRMAL